MKWQDLTLREKVFQTIVAVSRDIKKEGSPEAFFAKYPVGSLYFTKSGGAPDLAPLMENGTVGSESDYLLSCKKASRIPLIVCADGANIGKNGKTLGSSASLLATRDKDLAYRVGKALGMQMNYNHIDWILTPRMDLSLNRAGDIGDIDMSDDPVLTGEIFGAVIRGIQDEGIAATAKHFPGCGTHHVNPHFGPGENTLSLERWWETFGNAYKACIDAGVQSVMTTHDTLLSYTTEKENGRIPIATYSSKLTEGLLKGELGFNGVVVTDALCMGASAGGDRVKDAVDAFKAGADFLLWAPMEAGDRIVQLIESGEIPMSRLEDALTRIWKLREFLGMTNENRTEKPVDSDFVDATFAETMLRGIELVRNRAGLLPLQKDKIKKILVIGNAPEDKLDYLSTFADILREKGFAVDYKKYLLSCWEDVIRSVTDGYDLVIELMNVPFAIRAYPDCTSTTWAFHLVEKEKRMIVNFSSPFIADDYYPEDHTFITAYHSPTAEIFRRIVSAMVGECTLEGKSPVKLRER